MKLAATGVALCLTLVACASKPASKSTTTPSARPSSPAHVAITAPANGSTVKGPTIHLVVGLDGATIVAFTTKDIKPDEGHIHVKLDGNLVSMTAGLTSDIPDVKPGSHLLEVEFVAADHAPFDPRVFAGNTFRVT